jgi:Glyoxalase-like domain
VHPGLEGQTTAVDRVGNKKWAGRSPWATTSWPTVSLVAARSRGSTGNSWRAVNRARHYVGPMVSVKQFQVTFDCADPEQVARFWCQVLGYVDPPPPDGFATWDDFGRSRPPERQGSEFACMDPSGVGPRLFFQRVPEGKVVKNRVHLDVRVGTGLVGEERLATLDAECSRLLALGAVRVRVLLADGENESCIVMQDIEGNEFCLD